jgi:LysR family transcriptional regulator, low CO2-responsive transcriptional regulator
VNATLRQFKVFEMVARHLSFTRAAEELFLTQPAVSMQIKQFEDNLGLVLFERLGRKIYLTEAGKEIYRLSREITIKLEETALLVDEMKGSDGGHLVVSVASTVQYFAIRLLAGFRQNYPKVNVSLKVTNHKGLLQLLDQNETDIVLMGKPPENCDLKYEFLLDNPLVIIAPPNHPLHNQENIALDVLKNHTFLMREQGSGTRTSVEKFFAENGVSVSASMEMNNNSAIKLGVEAGLGLGIVSNHTVDVEVESGRLVVLDVQAFPLMRKWYMVRREGKRLSEVGCAFEEFVRTEKMRFVRLAKSI